MAWVTAAIVGGASLINGVMQSNAAGNAAASQTAAARDANATQLQMYNQSRADQEPWRQYGMSALDQLNGHKAGYSDLSAKYDEAIKNRDYINSLINNAGGQHLDARWGPGAQQYQSDADKYKSQMDAMGPQLSGADLGNSIMQNDPGYQFRLDQGNKAINAAASARGNAMGGRTMKELSRYGQDYASQEYGNAYNRLAAQAGVGQAATNNMANLGQQYGAQYGQNMASIGNANAAGQIGQANAAGGVLQNGMNGYMMYNLFNKPKVGG